MDVQTYLIFDGRCEEAAQFYKKALGAEILNLTRFKDSPQPHAPGMLPPGSENKIMHMTLKIGDTTLMGSDGRNKGEPAFHGFSLSIMAPDDAEAARLFAAISDGGTVTMPLAKTFFSSQFGTVIDRFGVAWMMLVRH